MAFIQSIETLLYGVSRVFLLPVMLLIAASLLYALVMLGVFVMEAAQRRFGGYRRLVQQYGAAFERGELASDDLELVILKQLEWLRIVSRAAPMLGLIATMIPMGPALLALGQHDGAMVGRQMVAAFSSVILALLAASISFFILTIRRRWLLEDLRYLEQRQVLEQGQVQRQEQYHE